MTTPSEHMAALAQEINAMEAERRAKEKACEHPTETVLELGSGRRRYTCDGCRLVRYLEAPSLRWLP